MKNFLISLSVIVSTSILVTLIFEVYVRITWDTKELGKPGMVLSHPTRSEIFQPNFEGWFAGQRIRINNLGFRDQRDYEIPKKIDDFRILIIGDSVTFGHGEKFKFTYPKLLEDMLKDWDKTVNWQVWNLGVPGYSATQVLNTIDELGPIFKPDLIIYGFYENDIYIWDSTKAKKYPKIYYNVKWFIKSNLYLYSKIRLAYNKIRYRAEIKAWQKENIIDNDNWWGGSAAKREFVLQSQPEDTGYDSIRDFGSFDFEPKTFLLKHNLKTKSNPPYPINEFNPKIIYPQGYGLFNDVVSKMKKYHSDKKYKIIFFINTAPDIGSICNNELIKFYNYMGKFRNLEICENELKIFVNGKKNDQNTYYLDYFDSPTYSVSSYSAFWNYLPEEVPVAGGHSRTAANLVKADVLFQFIIDNKKILE